MKHQPFEDWLLSTEPLEPKRKAELGAHLRECPSCRSLQTGLQRVETALRAAKPASPGPGFSFRFEARLEADRRRRRQARGWRLLTVAMGSVGLLVVAIGLVYAWTGGSMAFLFARGVQELVRWVFWARVAAEVGQSLLSSFPLVAVSGVALWFTGLTVAIGLTASAWSLSFRRFSLRGVGK